MGPTCQLCAGGKVDLAERLELQRAPVLHVVHGIELLLMPAGRGAVLGAGRGVLRLRLARGGLVNGLARLRRGGRGQVLRALDGAVVGLGHRGCGGKEQGEQGGVELHPCVGFDVRLFRNTGSIIVVSQNTPASEKSVAAMGSPAWGTITNAARANTASRTSSPSP